MKYLPLLLLAVSPRLRRGRIVLAALPPQQNHAPESRGSRDHRDAPGLEDLTSAVHLGARLVGIGCRLGDERNAVLSLRRERLDRELARPRGRRRDRAADTQRRERRERLLLERLGGRRTELGGRLAHAQGRRAQHPGSSGHRCRKKGLCGGQRGRG